MNMMRLLSLSVGAALVLACNAEDPELDSAAEEALDTAADAAVCPDVSGTLVDRSLAITDPTVLAKFSFSRVMNRIRVTANAGATPATLPIFQAWMGTFGDTATTGNCTAANIDPNDYGLVCPRTAEAQLASVNPFAANATTTFLPVAVMNRLDLAPTNGSNCGEYRIIYAMNSSTVNGRGFIIFEGTLPNPTPAAGADACLPVAQFWQGLSADASATSRANKLEKFFITGGAVAGFPALVNAAHYGLLDQGAAARNPGQIRTNMFIDGVEWHLREFKTRRKCTNVADAATCSLSFDHVTVKANPAEELFAGTHAKSAAFVTNFVNQVPLLARNNLNTIAMKPQDQFNEFESSAQAGTVIYKNFDNATIRTAIQNKLTAIGSTLTINNILDRATTQTCGGCHQHSNGQALGGGKTWPSSRTFVHVDEGGGLSTALTGTFLPHRLTVLESFINNRCDGSVAPAAAAGMTLGGGEEGAAN